jgi:hypothetical protein
MFLDSVNLGEVMAWPVRCSVDTKASDYAAMVQYAVLQEKSGRRARFGETGVEYSVKDLIPAVDVADAILQWLITPEGFKYFRSESCNGFIDRVRVPCPLYSTSASSAEDGAIDVAVIQHLWKSQKPSSSLAWCIHKLGVVFEARGRLLIARQLFIQSLAMQQDVWKGADHQDALVVKASLAAIVEVISLRGRSRGDISGGSKSSLLSCLPHSEPALVGADWVDEVCGSELLKWFLAGVSVPVLYDKLTLVRLDRVLCSTPLPSCVASGVETGDVSSALDAYLRGGYTGLSRRASLLEWMRERHAPDVVDQFGDLVVHWLSFAYLGCVREDTPAVWLLAVAGSPFFPGISPGLPLAKVLGLWLRELPTLTPASSLSPAILRSFEWSSTSDASPRLARDLDVVMWLSVLSREVLAPCGALSAWYCCGGSDQCLRDKMFERLGMWCRKGWKSLGPAWIRCFQSLSEAIGVPLDSVCRLQEQLGVALPGDLRRLLLEVGDVGVPLFGIPLIQSPPLWDPGQWLWERATCLQLTDVRLPACV